MNNSARLNKTINLINTELQSKLIPENIKYGVKILNTTGTLSEEVKHFNTLEEMNADKSEPVGTYAMVYDGRYNELDGSSVLTKLYFPSQIIIPSGEMASATKYYCKTEGGTNQDVYLQTSSNQIQVYDNTKSDWDKKQLVTYNGTYETIDGVYSIVYTRTKGDEYYEFETPLYPIDTNVWPSYFGKVFKDRERTFTGYYQYNYYSNQGKYKIPLRNNTDQIITYEVSDGWHGVNYYAKLIWGDEYSSANINTNGMYTLKSVISDYYRTKTDSYLYDLNGMYWTRNGHWYISVDMTTANYTNYHSLLRILNNDSTYNGFGVMGYSNTGVTPAPDIATWEIVPWASGEDITSNADIVLTNIQFTTSKLGEYNDGSNTNHVYKFTNESFEDQYPIMLHMGDHGDVRGVGIGSVLVGANNTWQSYAIQMTDCVPTLYAEDKGYKWLIAANDLTVDKTFVWNGTFYGGNGVESGIMSINTNLSLNQLKLAGDIAETFSEVRPEQELYKYANLFVNDPNTVTSIDFAHNKIGGTYINLSNINVYNTIDNTGINYQNITHIYNLNVSNAQTIDDIPGYLSNLQYIYINTYNVQNIRDFMRQTTDNCVIEGVDISKTKRIDSCFDYSSANWVNNHLNFLDNNFNASHCEYVNNIYPSYYMPSIKEWPNLVYGGNIYSAVNAPGKYNAPVDMTDLSFPEATTLINMFGRYINTIDNVYAPKVENASRFIYYAYNIVSVSNLNMPNVIDATAMFYGCNNLTTISVNLTKAEQAESLFGNCSKLTNINNCIFGNNLKNTSAMFYNCSNLTDININSTSSENTQTMYANCINLQYAHLTPESTMTSTNCVNMFLNCNHITDWPLEFNLSNAKNLSSMFAGSSINTVVNFQNIPNINSAEMMYANSNISGPLNFTVLNDQNSRGTMGNMFSNTNITSANITIPEYPLYYSGLVSNCKRLTTANITCNEVMINNGHNTINGYTPASMVFLGCSALTDVNISGNYHNGAYMFSNCTNLKNVTGNANFIGSYSVGWGTTQFISDMFYNCSNISDLSNITITVANYNWNGHNAFYNCTNLVTVPNFVYDNSTSNPKPYTIYNMFYRCNKLSQASINKICEFFINIGSPYYYQNLNNTNKYSPFYGTNIGPSRYSAYQTALRNKGWSF